MSTPAATKRLRLLHALHARPHRYSIIRWFSLGITFVVLYGVPLLGLARFDLWDGRHMAAGRPAGFVYGAGALFIGFFSFYVITFVLNAALGRIFCGFGCPVGQTSRLGDDVEAAKPGRERLVARARAAAFALALAAAIALWLVSPRVFVEGSARAVLATIGGVAALAAGVYLHGRFWRWRFCQDWCPIGIYYSAVQTAHGFGIHFDAASGNCKECGSCDLICPVALHPRDLSKPKEGLRGIAIDGFPEQGHCLTCGECVRACENQYRKEGRELVPLRLSVHAAPPKREPPREVQAAALTTSPGARTTTRVSPLGA